MSNYESQHEIDDERLSAYLDDELSPEERAAVESRLAQDPVARETLHQLRAVSQAVQALPQEIVGHDLGEVVLRRVTRSGPPSPPPPSDAMEDGPSSIDRAAPLDSSMPKLTIGRTRRGWVWASLAVAAALLVMVFQPDRAQEDGVPAVALRNEQVVRDEPGTAAANRGKPELRSLSETAPAQRPGDSELTDLSTSTQSAQAEWKSNGLQPNQSLSLEPATQPPSNERASDLDAVADTAPARARGAAVRPTAQNPDTTQAEVAPAENSPTGAVTDATVDSTAADSLSATPPTAGDSNLADELTDWPTQDEQPVVVRVLVRREALQNKVFDRLLESHGIEVETEAETVAAMPTVRAQSESQVVEQNQLRQLRDNRDAKTTSGSEEELVLVDAPASVIASSLETLNADNVNYLGIKVDDTATQDQFSPGAVADDALPEQEALAKKQAVPEGWTKYNRGAVPQSNGAFSQDHLYFYDRADRAADRYGIERGVSGGYGRGGYGGARGPQPVTRQRAVRSGVATDRKELGERNLGRAYRLHTWAFESQPQPEQLNRRGYAAPDDSAAVALQLSPQRQAVTDQAGAAGDRMRVLFVISPADVPASSPPARNKAQ